MADTQIMAAPAVGGNVPLKLIDNGDGTFSFQHVESATQRTALLAALTPILTSVDGLEALATTLNGLITTQNGYLDGVETLLGAATPAGENHLGEVGGNSAIVGGNFNRPADTTPYSIGDVVANSTTAGSVVPIPIAAARKNAGTGRILRARLSKTSATIGSIFRVHFFKTAPTSTAGDNAAFASAVTGVAALHLGYVDITMDQAFSDGAKGIGVAAVGSFITFDAAAGTQNIFALIEARTAYTPTSGETFTLAVEVDRD